MIAALLLLTLILAPAPTPFAFATAAPPPEPPTVECSAETPAGCVERVYQAVYDDAPLTLGDVLAITARAELGLFYDLGHGDAASEALFRSWFDPQSGACPAGVDCTYDNLIRYLSSTQVFRDAVTVDGVVNLERVYGRGERYLDYKDNLETAIDANPDWQSGQAPDKASIWGNRRLEPGTVAYPASDEIFAVVIVHHYPAGGYSFGEVLRNGETPDCSLASVIVSTEGRLREGVSTCHD